jgi:hypothetical protein
MGRLQVARKQRTKSEVPLKRRGIQFIDENGGGPGVRLRKRQRAKTR